MSIREALIAVVALVMMATPTIAANANIKYALEFGDQFRHRVARSSAMSWSPALRPVAIRLSASCCRRRCGRNSLRGRRSRLSDRR
jgi:hypothetical protein